LRAAVALVYGIDAGLRSGCKPGATMLSIHVMTGVSWGNYQDIMAVRRRSNEDEAQTDRNGNKIGTAAMFIYK